MSGTRIQWIDVLGYTQIQNERGQFYILSSDWYSPCNGSEVDKRKSTDLSLFRCRHTTTLGNFA